MEYRCQKFRNLFFSFLLCFGISGCDALTKSNQPDPAIKNRNFTNISIVGAGGEVGTLTAVTVTLVDKQGYGFANYTPTITAANALGSSADITYAACGVTDYSGVANCYITSKAAGIFNLELTSPVVATGSQVTFTQVARALKFTQSPSDSVSSTAFATQPIVQIVDNVGNALTTPTDATITLSLTLSNGAALAPAGVLTKTSTSGIADFTGLGLNVNLVGTYTLKATATGLTQGISNSFTITAGTATKLAFATQPSPTTAANTAFAAQPIIKLTDTAGNTVTTNSTCVVTMSLTTSANAADTLVGNQLSVITSSGIADFTGKNLRINTEFGGTTYVLTATAAGSGCGSANGVSIASNPITITLSGVPASILITQSPSAVNTLNVLFSTQPVITVYDSFGAAVTSDNSTVITASVSTGGGATSGSLYGSTSIGVTNGVATFTDLEILESATPATDAGSYNLQFTATNPNVAAFPLTVSQSVYVNNHGTIPAKMVFQTQPAKAAKLQTMAPFTVAIEDANGFICANDNSNTVTIAAIPQASSSTGSASGTLTQTAVNGIVTFNDVSINLPGIYTMNATSSSLSVTTQSSAPFAITSFGSADHPAFTVEPSSTSTLTGAAFTTQPAVSIMDKGGNVVTSDESSVVTLTCVNPSGCTLLGTTSKTVVNGTATFSGLSFGSAEAAAVLQATITSSASTLSTTTADSTSFTVTSTGSGASQLSFSTQPSTISAVESAALTTQPVVHVLTSGGVLDSTDNSTTVTLSCVSPSGCTLTGTTSMLDVNGVATFTNIGVNEPSGTSGIVIQATSSGLSSGNSAAFAIP